MNIFCEMKKINSKYTIDSYITLRKSRLYIKIFCIAIVWILNWDEQTESTGILQVKHGRTKE